MVFIKKKKNGECIFTFLEAIRGDLKNLPKIKQNQIEMEGESESEKIKRMEKEERKKQIQQQLQLWKDSFEKQNGKKPSKDDLFTHPLASQLFKEYSSL